AASGACWRACVRTWRGPRRGSTCTERTCIVTAPRTRTRGCRAAPASRTFPKSEAKRLVPRGRPPGPRRRHPPPKAIQGASPPEFAMLRPDTFALTALLALITALGPVSTDMYLPSLPDIGRLLSTDPAHVQLTLSAYLAGFAAGQIIYGPFSD